LTALKINSEPFFPKEIKKEKKTKIATNEVNVKKDFKAEITKESVTVNETKNKNLNSTYKKEAYATEETKETLTKLQKISMGEIKEYIPKKFKLVSKEKQ
jgi:hypothetical protein